ncbi:MAG: lactate permease LctP family transporter [Bryobacteraceae bacterium]|nr:lactate permease LctP family transporter [Bryobacteraceae bacterium]
MTWTQNYTPLLDSLVASTLVALIPVIVLLGLLAFFHVRAHVAALAGLAAVLLAAILVYHMPVRMALTAAGYGALYGLLPIGWIVLNVVFLYDITVQTGQFEFVKQSIAGLSADRRIQVLLVAFSFGAFIEGAAGFGAPVAISAVMLIGFGFRPLQAATLSLIGNTAPVAFGSLGIPIISLAEVTGLPLLELSAMTGRQLPFFSLLIPFWLVATLAGWRAMLAVWPACLVSGLSFAVVQFLMSNLHGPWLVDTASALASIGALLLLLRFWRPREVWLFSHEQAVVGGTSPARASRGVLLRAWAPWLILTAVVFVWALPSTKNCLNTIWLKQFPVPGLHQAVLKAPPLASELRPENAIYFFNLLSATGTAPLLSALIAGLLLGLGPMALARAWLRTLWRVRLSLLTISAMLALAFASRYAGLDSTLGLAFASTGTLFPFFSPLLGWLGVALTGSDTASNVLFGNLQQITAHQVGISPVLAAAANTTGGVMGKMIDAQSIVVAGVATGQHGQEGQILRSVFWHSLTLAILVGLLVLTQAYLFPGIVP